MKIKLKRTCKICGKEFELKHWRQKYCSKECAGVVQRNQTAEAVRKYWERHRSVYNKTCPVCGKEFETTYTHKKYCSEECAAKAKQETIEQWRYRTGAKKVYHRICPVCGAEFETSHNLKKYCSDQCRDEATKKLQDAYNKKKLEERRKKSQAQKATKIKPQTKKIKPQSASKIKPVKVTQEPVIIPINPETGKYIVTCVGCGKTFETPDKSQRYCSFRCRMSSIDKRQRDKERASAERAIKAMERARN